jgi:hypothetical protein
VANEKNPAPVVVASRLEYAGQNIPDLIAAAPGFSTTEKMPTNAFRAKGLSFYVKQ